jgi:hypothetical protein
MRKFAPTLLCLPLVALAMAACNDDPDKSASSPGNQQQVSGSAPLHDARLDLAERLDIPRLDIGLCRFTPPGSTAAWAFVTRARRARSSSSVAISRFTRRTASITGITLG